MSVSVTNCTFVWSFTPPKRWRILISFNVKGRFLLRCRWFLCEKKTDSTTRSLKNQLWTLAFVYFGRWYSNCCNFEKFPRFFTRKLFFSGTAAFGFKPLKIAKQSYFFFQLKTKNPLFKCLKPLPSYWSHKKITMNYCSYTAQHIDLKIYLPVIYSKTAGRIGLKLSGYILLMISKWAPNKERSPNSRTEPTQSFGATAPQPH